MALQPSSPCSSRHLLANPDKGLPASSGHHQLPGKETPSDLEMPETLTWVPNAWDCARSSLISS